MIVTNLQNIKSLNQLKEKSYKIHSLNPSSELFDFLFKVEDNLSLRLDLQPEIEKQINSFIVLNETPMDTNKIRVNKLYYQGIGNIELV